MKISESRAKLATDPQNLARTEGLLLRYPEVSSDEVEEIGRYLRRASAMDMGLLSTNHQAWSNAERYRLDHPRMFATTAKEKLIWTIATLTVIAIFVLLWDSGLGR